MGMMLKENYGADVNTFNPDRFLDNPVSTLMTEDRNLHSGHC